MDPRSSSLLHGAGVPPPPPPLPPRGISEDEVKKRKNAATYCRPVKPKPAPPLPAPPPPPPGSAPRPDAGASVRRKKPGTPPPGFEEKRSAMKVGLRCWGGPRGGLGGSWGCRGAVGGEARQKWGDTAPPRGHQGHQHPQGTKGDPPSPWA